jgi:adenylate cyclase
VTEHTRAAAGNLAFLEVDRVRVAGRSAPISVFALLGDETLSADENFQTLAGDHAAYWRSYRQGETAEAADALARARSHGRKDLEKLYGIYAERLADRVARPNADGSDVFERHEK